MAKRSTKFKPGTHVRVVEGSTMPEFEDVSIAGWTGMVLESRGRGDNLKYIVEWSDETLQNLPAAFLELAEQQQLATEMACLSANAVEATGLT